MLMNGKEANHLVINGEVFDKSYVGRQVKLIKTMVDTDSHLSASGGRSNGTGGTAFESGQICTVMANYHSFFYCYANKFGLNFPGFWVKRDEFEFID